MTDQWCILRMAGPRTLAVAESLTEAGFGCWTPIRTIMRPIPGQRRSLALGQRRAMMEKTVPIIPGFVFAPASSLIDIASIAVDPCSRHPSFCMFQVAERAPIIGERSLTGLRAEQAKADQEAEILRENISRQDARKLRAERMRTERARRKALRSERRDFNVGDAVTVIDMPAMQGMVGSIVKSNGKAAKVSFGGAWEVEVEAWQIVPNALMDSAA